MRVRNLHCEHCDVGYSLRGGGAYRSGRPPKIKISVSVWISHSVIRVLNIKIDEESNSELQEREQRVELCQKNWNSSTGTFMNRNGLETVHFFGTPCSV
ncbi:hypothetical protein J6590_083422 [Homalodisca vitripennis]|nr:hypothetical protein J6590_083422 [Homalodisca vitripennis]